MGRVTKLRKLGDNSDAFFETSDLEWREWYQGAEAGVVKFINQLSHRNNKVINAVFELKSRLYILIKIQTALELVNAYPELKNVNPAEFIKAYEEDSNDLENNFIKTMFRLALLKNIAHIFGSSGRYCSVTKTFVNDSNTELGNLNCFGYTGMTPLWYINLFEHKAHDASLRELMYLVYRCNSSEITVLYFNDIEFIEKANNVLNDLNYTWKINLEFITDYCSSTAFSSKEANQLDNSIFKRTPYSNFTRNENLRITRENPCTTSLSLDRPSKREQFALNAVWSGISASQAFCFNPEANSSHPYFLKLLTPKEDASKFFMSGASGATDSVLSVCLCLGFDQLDFLNNIRIALIGTMVPAKDHNLLEIGFSSMGFKLPFSLASKQALYDSLGIFELIYDLRRIPDANAGLALSSNNTFRRGAHASLKGVTAEMKLDSIMPS